jgi:hypothetical protein
MSAFNGVKVFAATMVQQRAAIGDQVERWLEAMRQRPSFEMVDIVISQSSDDAFHCFSIVLFFRECLSAPKINANADTSSKAATPTSARTVISNAGSVENLPTSTSANAHKKRH